MATTGAFADWKPSGPITMMIGFAANALRPMEFGGDMGTKAIATAVIEQIAITG